MKQKRLLTVLVLSALTTVSLLIAGNGNGDGTCNNSSDKVKIYHRHGNGTYSLMHVPEASLSGHAAHGDMWYQTGCPLTGAEWACW